MINHRYWGRRVKTMFGPHSPMHRLFRRTKVPGLIRLSLSPLRLRVLALMEIPAIHGRRFPIGRPHKRSQAVQIRSRLSQTCLRARPRFSPGPKRQSTRPTQCLSIQCKRPSATRFGRPTSLAAIPPSTPKRSRPRRQRQWPVRLNPRPLTACRCCAAKRYSDPPRRLRSPIRVFRCSFRTAKMFRI